MEPERLWESCHWILAGTYNPHQAFESFEAFFLQAYTEVVLGPDVPRRAAFFIANDPFKDD